MKVSLRLEELRCGLYEGDPFRVTPTAGGHRILIAGAFDSQGCVVSACRKVPVPSDHKYCGTRKRALHLIDERLDRSNHYASESMPVRSWTATPNDA
jgi:hypothetical protein